MARKYNTRCWLCGSTDLEPDDRGVRCRQCEATYNVIPKPSASLLTFINDPQKPGYQPKKESYIESSGLAKRKAAKARGEI